MATDIVNNLENSINDVVKDINEALQKQLNHSKDLNSLFQKKMVEIKQKTHSSKDILEKQIFGQQMMESLINDLLDLGNIENKAFKLTEEYFSLPEVIHQAFQIINTSAQKNGIDLKAEVVNKSDLNLITQIYGDKRRYQQILINFLSNSLKFTLKKGSITVRIEILESKEERQDQTQAIMKRIKRYSSKKFENLRDI